MSVLIKSHAVRNWVIAPVSPAANEAKPASITGQKWQLVLTGVDVVDFKGDNPHDWRRDKWSIFPDIVTAPLQYAIGRFGFPVPDPNLVSGPGLDLEQWAPFAAVSSLFSRESGTVDAGFAVDQWRVAPFNFGTDAVSGRQVTRVFNGIDVDVAVRNDQAILHRLSYHITLIGTIVFLDAG
jgi:hypothetical protein